MRELKKTIFWSAMLLMATIQWHAHWMKDFDDSWWRELLDMGTMIVCAVLAYRATEHDHHI